MNRGIPFFVVASVAAFALATACNGSDDPNPATAPIQAGGSDGGAHDSSAGGVSGWSGATGQSGGDGGGNYPLLDGGVCPPSAINGAGCWSYYVGTKCDSQCTHCQCSGTYVWNCIDTCDGPLPEAQDGGACPADVKSGDDCSNVAWDSTCESAGVSCICLSTSKWACGTPCDESPSWDLSHFKCASCAATGASCFNWNDSVTCLAEAGTCTCDKTTFSWNCDGNP